MTKTQKKTIKFTKRNFFEFEHVKQKFETRTKRVKKNVIVSKKTIIKKKTINQITKDRKKRDENEKKRNDDEKKRDEDEAVTTTISHVTTSMITRSNATASKFMKLFNNIEFNDENVDFFFQQNSNDENFNVSKHENEIAEND